MHGKIGQKHKMIVNIQQQQNLGPKNKIISLEGNISMAFVHFLWLIISVESY